jgi:hypothetical protein
MNTTVWIISAALLAAGCSPNGSTIPDANIAGLTLGPARVGTSEEVLTTVDLMVDLIHPCTPDVAMCLGYDRDNDGRIDARAEIEFFRARRNGWLGAVANACTESLNGAYYFHAADTKDDPLEVFRGLRAGGSFYLAVTDTLAEDVGIVRDWSVRAESAIGASETDPLIVAGR